MDAFCDRKVWKVVLMAASQIVGKSQMMNNVIGRFIDVDPSNMLIMHPTIAAAEKWSIGRLDPLIQETERLHDKIQPRKSRSIGDRILHPQFRGG
jgi:phage terminase large subunit GpA-like protein